VIVREVPLARELDALIAHEWLVTNGLGGYASGTVLGALTRRYHGLLVAAHAAPLGRMLLLANLVENVRLPDGRSVDLSAEERMLGGVAAPGAAYLTRFHLEDNLPVWRWRIEDHVLERRVLMPHLQNTVHVGWRLIEGPGPVRLKVRPGVCFRGHDDPVSRPLATPYVLRAIDDRIEIAAGDELPALRLFFHGARKALTLEPRLDRGLRYRVEERRGYDHQGDVWSPGFFRAELEAGGEATLIGSSENWDTVLALSPADARAAEARRRAELVSRASPAARAGFAAELVLAADQFVITPVGRTEDAARARAAGDEVRTVIAGYPWFTDWGRDTMISLEGLALITGRHLEAGYILRTFAGAVRDGLIPNLFPEGEREGLYHTADATLWFFHAIDRYLAATGDRRTLRLLLPALEDIVKRHLAGTRFGIGVDARDGLLAQGAAGYQLTWMDAKVGDWVVTPRRGKSVEINALWFNALRLLEGWLREERGDAAARPLADLASRVEHSFNARFWYEPGGHLHDVVDAEGGGDDPSFRPNQIFAVALPHAVLAQARWQQVVDAVRAKLWTPVGLRSLARGERDYKARYDGDLRARDAAYHQGTVWGWLAGPMVDAWLKVYPQDVAGARELLAGFDAHFGEGACAGSISEIFEAEPPYTPRGCFAQAWSVAEVLRALVRLSR
jgi:predicted glycogen debranching enzyme